MQRVWGCGLVMTLVVVACSSDESTPQGTAGTGGHAGSSAGTGGKSGSGGVGGSGGSGGTSSGGTAGADGAADAGLPTLSGTVVDASPGNFGSEPLLAGVEVCVVDGTGVKNTAIPCATTNAAGEYALANLTPNQQLIVMFSKSGYSSQLIAADIGTSDVTRGPMRLSAQQTDSGADGGSVPNFGWDPTITIDPAKGSMNIAATQPAATADSGVVPGFPGLDWTTGVSFTITPTGGNGPYYVNPNETWASSATATVNAWGAWFMNLAPGTYTVTATHPTLSCRAGGGGYGWAQTDGTAKAPIIAGMNTQAIAFICTPPPSDGGGG